jgi:hypothetical protein
MLATKGTAAGHEWPRQVDPSSALDVRAVGYIAMNLMQKAPLENGRVGLEHPERWPEDAQLFLAEAISLTSAKELSQVSGASITSTGGSDSCSYHYFPVPASRPGSNGFMI